MSEAESNIEKFHEPLRPEVYRIEEPSHPFGMHGEPPLPSPSPSGGLTPKFPRLPLILFVLTIFSTWYAGIGMFSEEDSKGNVRIAVWEGLQYSILVLTILSAHEMGHYLQARRYRVPASLPMFIPMPFGPIGTMGAVIFQRPGVAGRRAMYDIAISGPLAGLAVALPVLWWGLLHSKVDTLPVTIAANKHLLIIADPLLTQVMGWLIHGPLRPNQELGSNPFVFAGWVGIFITALNLFPLGQLDGGHILYTLLGKPAHSVARVLFRGLVLAMFVAGFYEPSYLMWMVMLFLVWRMGVEHPPTADDAEPLGTGRRVLGWATLSFVVLGFVPLPMYELKDADLKARHAEAAALSAQKKR